MNKTLKRKVNKIWLMQCIRVDNKNICLDNQDIEQGYKDYNGKRYMLVFK